VFQYDGYFSTFSSIKPQVGQKKDARLRARMTEKNGAKSFIETRFGKTRDLATNFVVPLRGLT